MGEGHSILVPAWNTDPKPHGWTETADENLERLASYLNRIPDSEDLCDGARAQRVRFRRASVGWQPYVGKAEVTKPVT
ncbi:hypothetical protein ACE1SV_65650 [Streptomyces sennicomposti]